MNVVLRIDEKSSVKRACSFGEGRKLIPGSEEACIEKR